MNKVYFLSDPINKEIRYVGITKKKLYKRLSEHISESVKKQTCHKHKWINSLIKKGLNPKIELFLESESRKFIVYCEIFLIKELKDLGFRLTNTTSGGEDKSGSSNPMFGRENKWGKHSEETKKKLSKKFKGRINYWIRGDRHPMKNQDTLKKVSKKIEQLDLENNSVNVFWGMREAERKTGCDHSAISKCCRGILKTTGGYKWRYIYD